LQTSAQKNIQCGEDFAEDEDKVDAPICGKEARW
jgi:hypothetical protein